MMGSKPRNRYITPKRVLNMDYLLVVSIHKKVPKKVLTHKHINLSNLLPHLADGKGKKEALPVGEEASEANKANQQCHSLIVPTSVPILLNQKKGKCRFLGGWRVLRNTSHQPIHEISGENGPPPNGSQQRYPSTPKWPACSLTATGQHDELISFLSWWVWLSNNQSGSGILAGPLVNT